MRQDDTYAGIAKNLIEYIMGLTELNDIKPSDVGFLCKRITAASRSCQTTSGLADAFLALAGDETLSLPERGLTGVIAALNGKAGDVDWEKCLADIDSQYPEMSTHISDNFSPQDVCLPVEPPRPQDVPGSNPIEPEDIEGRASPAGAPQAGAQDVPDPEIPEQKTDKPKKPEAESINASASKEKQPSSEKRTPLRDDRDNGQGKGAPQPVEPLLVRLEEVLRTGNQQDVKNFLDGLQDETVFVQAFKMLMKPSHKGRGNPVQNRTAIRRRLAKTGLLWLGCR